MLMNKILDTYQGFKEVQELVDVGGGVGSTLNLIVSRYPHISGINFDMPHVVTDAPYYPGKSESPFSTIETSLASLCMRPNLVNLCLFSCETCGWRHV
jgi:hypothetical protein